MKQRIFLALMVLCAIISTNVYGAGIVMCMRRACENGYVLDAMGTNCAQSSDTCFDDGYVGVRSCSSCPSGYSLESKSVTLLTDNGGTCNTTYNTCVGSGTGGGGEDDCDGTCDNCNSDLVWRNVALGYQAYTTATCNEQTCFCSKKTTFRCAGGYYGNPPAIQMVGNYTGCDRCPDFGSSGAGASKAGSTKITQCYVSAGTTSADETGGYTYTQNCYYSE